MRMDVSSKISRDAELDNLIAKIVMLTVFPFFMIVVFESILINGAKILLNSIILVLNTSHSHLFPNPATVSCLGKQPSESPAQSPIKGCFSVSSMVDMPSPDESAKKKVEDIVTTLATGSWITLIRAKSRLEKYHLDLEPIHPFQFLEAIFGDDSVVKPLMPKLMNCTSLITNPFLDGLSTGMKNLKHKKNINTYLPSFSEKMKADLNEIHAFIYPVENMKGLVMHLIKIHCSNNGN